VNCVDLDGKFLGTAEAGGEGAWNFVKNNPALVCGTLSFIAPPPLDFAFGAAAVGFSAYSAASNVRHGHYGAAAGDIIGAVPGGGSAFRGAPGHAGRVPRVPRRTECSLRQGIPRRPADQTRDHQPDAPPAAHLLAQLAVGGALGQGRPPVRVSRGDRPHGLQVSTVMRQLALGKVDVLNTSEDTAWIF
jgi:hypothetical protein